MKRRDFLRQSLSATPILAMGPGLFETNHLLKGGQPEDGFVSLFDGKTLEGWYASPRLPIPSYPGGRGPDKESESYKKAMSSKGRWTVENGAIVGGQEPPGSGLGGYLVSDETFADFELLVDSKPDWPVDTGILVRAGSIGVPGYQILVDHRKSGGIGGFYGNGLAGFHALPYNFDARYDAAGNAIGLVPESPETTNEPLTDAKINMLSYAAPVEEFLEAWKWGDWNTFKIRCEGKHPYLTTWINGVKICELDTAKIQHPNYDKEEVAKTLGREGHISFEVHDNDPLLGKNRWYPGAVCRWKNIYIKKL